MYSTLYLISDAHFGILHLAHVQRAGFFTLLCLYVFMYIAGELWKLSCPSGINSYLNLNQIIGIKKYELDELYPDSQWNAISIYLTIKDLLCLYIYLDEESNWI